MISTIFTIFTLPTCRKTLTFLFIQGTVGGVNKFDSKGTVEYKIFISREMIRFSKGHG